MNLYVLLRVPKLRMSHKCITCCIDLRFRRFKEAADASELLVLLGGKKPKRRSTITPCAFCDVLRPQGEGGDVRDASLESRDECSSPKRGAAPAVAFMAPFLVQKRGRTRATRSRRSRAIGRIRQKAAPAQRTWWGTVDISGFTWIYDRSRTFSGVLRLFRVVIALELPGLLGGELIGVGLGGWAQPDVPGGDD